MFYMVFFFHFTFKKVVGTSRLSGFSFLLRYHELGFHFSWGLVEFYWGKFGNFLFLMYGKFRNLEFIFGIKDFKSTS